MSMGAVDDRFESEAELPLVLTVEEAARVLRIGRTLAYSLARRYETSGGVAGLPVIRLGSCLRVPRRALVELACSGRVVALAELVAHAADLLSRLVDEPPIVHGEQLHEQSDVPPDPGSQLRQPKRAPCRAAEAVGVGQQLVLVPSD
jgi:Helix-turn-helix domain